MIDRFRNLEMPNADIRRFRPALVIGLVALGPLTGCASEDDALQRQSREYELRLQTLEAKSAQERAEKERQRERAAREEAERKRLEAELRAKQVEAARDVAEEKRKRDEALRRERQRQATDKRQVVESLNELASAQDQVRDLRQGLAGLSLRLSAFEDAARLEDALRRAGVLDNTIEILGQEIGAIRDDVNRSRGRFGRELNSRMKKVANMVLGARNQLSDLQAEIARLEDDQRALQAGPAPEDIWPGMAPTRWQGVDRRIREFIGRAYGNLIEFNAGY